LGVSRHPRVYVSDGPVRWDAPVRVFAHTEIVKITLIGGGYAR